MPIYGFSCPSCDAAFDWERPLTAASQPAPCPVCGTESPRAISSPRFLFKGDPRDNRPAWHNHEGYSHSHAPRRGRHRSSSEDH